MNFPYLYVSESMDSINIEDFGNVSLKLCNDTGSTWYLLIKTSLGWTTTQSFGPVSLEDDVLPYQFQYNYSLKEYNDTKIIKEIDKYINDPKKLITQIFFITEEEAIEKLKNLHERS